MRLATALARCPTGRGGATTVPSATTQLAGRESGTGSPRTSGSTGDTGDDGDADRTPSGETRTRDDGDAAPEAEPGRFGGAGVSASGRAIIRPDAGSSASRLSLRARARSNSWSGPRASPPLLVEAEFCDSGCSKRPARPRADGGGSGD